jgi:hypothetical protein
VRLWSIRGTLGVGVPTTIVTFAYGLPYVHLGASAYSEAALPLARSLRGFGVENDA